MHRTGFLGLFGPKVDSIDFYTKELDELEKECEEISTGILEGKGHKSAKLRRAAFVTFHSAKQATVAAQCQMSHNPGKWRVLKTPAPEDVEWFNVGRLNFFEMQVSARALPGGNPRSNRSQPGERTERVLTRWRSSSSSPLARQTMQFLIAVATWAVVVFFFPLIVFVQENPAPALPACPLCSGLN